MAGLAGATEGLRRTHGRRAGMVRGAVAAVTALLLGLGACDKPAGEQGTKEPAPSATPAPTKPIETKPAETKPAETKPAPAAEPAPAPAAEPAAEPDEFGEFETAAEPAKPMTGKELQEWITAHLQAKKIDTASVKAILAKYGAARTMDTKDEDRPKIKAEIEAALKK